MRYIVDGYNAIRRDAVLRRLETEGGLEAGRDALLSRILASGILAKARVLVVFDGSNERGHAGAASRRHPKLNVRFSRSPQSADDAILALLESNEASQETCVVTADAELAFGVRRTGASVVGPEGWDGLKSPGKRRSRSPQPKSGKPSPNAKDTSYWLEIFDED